MPSIQPAHMTNLPKRLEMQFGNAPALQSGSGRRAPDRRRVSLRWLFGTVLVGVTSALLMGGALFAALDGRQQLAIAASAMVGPMDAAGAGILTRGDRVHLPVAVPPAAERVMQVSTMTREGDADVIRKRPFAYASASLAIARPEGADYPAFDPLTVFRASGDDELEASSEAIYGADIESEVRVRYEPFPASGVALDRQVRVSTEEAQRIVAAARASLAEGEIAVSALPYIDDSRFGLSDAATPTSGLGISGPDISVVASNVTTILPSANGDGQPRNFREAVVPVAPGMTLVTALEPLSMFDNSGLGSPGRVMIGALQGEFGIGPLRPETLLRVAYEERGTGSDIVRTPKRISVYHRGNHLRSASAVDDGSVVWGMEPVALEAIARPPRRAGEQSRPEPVVATGDGPTVYDGIYRAALSQGLDVEQARRIIRTVAFDVDFRARTKPGDVLEVFYSLAEGETTAGAESEILHIALTTGGVARRYYRFSSVEDGKPHVDFYDETGRSAKKFLLRKPVPNGRFNSPFGPRRHPISRRVKMHNGVDFSAPRGTPILAAGNGTVLKAGWAGGYGRQTTIRHANGYETRYSHQNRIARGIKPGARVRLGQVIGQVGSTGFSTGPHLHYEVLVNGNYVNPMKIRLPQGRTLQGPALAAFKSERDRIDALMERGRGRPLDVAGL